MCARLRPNELMESAVVWWGLANLASKRLIRQRLLLQVDGLVELSPSGKQEALRLLRNHRLWETYMNQLGLPEDHVHDPADAVEHFINVELGTELETQVDDERDPQGKKIPPSN